MEALVRAFGLETCVSFIHVSSVTDVSDDECIAAISLATSTLGRFGESHGGSSPSRAPTLVRSAGKRAPRPPSCSGSRSHPYHSPYRSECVVYEVPMALWVTGGPQG